MGRHNFIFVEQGGSLTICFFCDRRNGDSGSEAIVDMHRMTSKSEWESLTTYVPRCTPCQAVHNKLEGAVGIGFLVGILVGIYPAILLIRNYERAPSGKAVIGIFAATCIPCGLLAGCLNYLLFRLFAPKEVKEQSLRKDFPAIKQLMSEGWQFGERPTVIK